MNTWQFHNLTLYAEREPNDALQWPVLVSSDEIMRAATMGSTVRAHSFLSCRAFLRRHLAPLMNLPVTDVPIRIDGVGKPFVPNGPAFSLSHSAGMMLIGIAPAGANVGVDVQHNDPATDIEKIAQRLFTAEDRAELDAAANRRAKGFELWCLREAEFKLGDTSARHSAAALLPGDTNYTYAACIA